MYGGNSLRIAILGATGLLGRELVDALAQAKAAGDAAELLTPTRTELDLLDALAVQRWFVAHRPEAVVLAAARVGGIAANLAHPVAFLTQNLGIQANVLLAAQAAGVRRLLWFGSSAMYPAQAEQPMAEGALLSGALDPALRAYALAKLAGVELSHALNHTLTQARSDALAPGGSHASGFRALCLVPPNLFGRYDRFDESATVLPSLMRRVAEARAAGQTTLSVWGTGRARRELLPAAELARAAVHFLDLPEAAMVEPVEGGWPVVNIGAGFDVSIGELAETVCRALNYPMELTFDASRPEGTLRKLLDSSRAVGMGWQAQFSLEAAIREVYMAAHGDGRLP